MALLADTLGGDTTTTIGFVLAIGSLVVGAVVTAISARVSQGAAIAQIREDLGKQERESLERDRRIKEIELYRARQEGLAEASAAPSSSTARGTQPYRR